MNVKLGGSMRYDDQGPQSPTPAPRWSVGGRSVSSPDVAPSNFKGTVIRPPARGGAYKPQPFNIKKKSAVVVEE